MTPVSSESYNGPNRVVQNNDEVTYLTVISISLCSQSPLQGYFYILTLLEQSGIDLNNILPRLDIFSH